MQFTEDHATCNVDAEVSDTTGILRRSPALSGKRRKGGLRRRLAQRFLCILVSQALVAETLLLPVPAFAQSDGAGDGGEGTCTPAPDNQKDEDPDDEDPDDADGGDPSDPGEVGGDAAQGPDDGTAEGSATEAPGGDTSAEAGDSGSGEIASGDVAGSDGSGNDGSGGSSVSAGGGIGGWGGGGTGGGGGSEFMVDPIDLRLADKVHVQVDYLGAGVAALRWTRVYHSNRTVFAAATTQRIGQGWRSFYDRSVQVLSATAVRLHRANGTVLDFSFNGSNWVTTSSGGTLTALASGWQYLNHRNTLETYGSNGRLTSMARRGLVTAMAYDGAGRLATVTNPFGRALVFSYDAANRVAAVTLPGGGTLYYGYDGSDRLVSVRFTDGALRQYAYENPSFPTALTGVIDESGRRRLTWGYDAAGRPNYGHYGSGVNAVGAVYNGDTVITSDARGTQRVRTFATVAGRRVMTSLQTAATNDAPATAWGFSYDGNGQPAATATRTGESRVHSYDARGRLLSGTRAAGTGIAATVQHTWHPLFRVPTQSQSAGITTNRSVDGFGRITQVTQTGVDGTIRTVEQRSYNAQNLLASVTDARGATTSFGYDGSGNLVSKTDALGRVTTFASHDAHGRPGRITRPDGTVITRSYDVRGRLSTRAVAGATTTYAYDDANRLLQVTRPDGSWRRRAYDAAGLLASVTNHRGESRVYSRDVDGKITGRATYTASGIVGQRTSRQYDSRGRLSAWLDSRGYRTAYNYGSDARLASVVDPAGRSRSINYDLLDRGISVTLPNTSAARLSGGPATVTSTRSFHPSYRRHIQTTDTVNVSSNYGHDGFNRKVLDSGNDAGNRSRTLNSAGDTTSFTDSRGITTTITRDTLGRVTKIAPSGGSLTSISYVAGRSDSLPSLVTEGSGSTSWTYDSVGRLLSKTQTVGSWVRAMSLTRDSTGKVTTVTYPSGLIVAYGYDADRVSSISVGGAVVISNITYLPQSSTPTGWRWSTGAYHSRGYDTDGRLTQVTLGPVTRSQSYDPAGRLTTIGDSGGAGTGTTILNYDELSQLIAQSGPAGTFGFAYDSNGNRLSQVSNGFTRTNGYAAGTNRILTSPNGIYTYDAAGYPINDGYYTLSYDGYGRLTALIAAADYSVQRKYNVQGLRVLSSANAWQSSNPTAGSPQSSSTQNKSSSLGAKVPSTPDIKGGSLPAWPAPLHLALRSGKLSVPAVGVKQASGVLQAGVPAATGGKWVAIDSRQFFYDDAGHLLGEYQNAAYGSYRQETVWFGGMPVAAVVNGVTHLISSDHLGTPRSLQRASDGVEVWHWDGEPFGASWPSPSAVEYNLRFPGQVYDAHTGYHYNWMRDYNPVTGRYLQPDPIGLAGGLSRYAYGGANPISNADPTGLFRMYGNWGGDSWSGGSSSGSIPSNPLPPVDALDACYQDHDYCYAGERSSCKAAPENCDQQLAHCLAKVQRGTGGIWGSIFGPASLVWSIFKGFIDPN